MVDSLLHYIALDLTIPSVPSTNFTSKVSLTAAYTPPLGNINNIRTRCIAHQHPHYHTPYQRIKQVTKRS